jgi:hypothetical protein
MKNQRKGVQVTLYSFFNLGAKCGGCLTPRLGCFPSGQETRFPMYRKPGGPQDRSGRVRETLPVPGFDPRAVQAVASRYTV